MKALDLIGAVGAADLRRRVDLIGAEDGIARFMLDRLRGDHVAAIVKALLDDAETARKFTIQIPSNLVADHGLPDHVLTDERSVNLRHTVWDTPALLLANTEDDQETSLQLVTPLGAKLLTAGPEAPGLWVTIASMGLPLAPEQLAVWSSALSGLIAAEDWSLQQMATYVAMTRQRIAEESQPLLDSLGWAMPALMLPRDSGYFRTIRQREQSLLSKWRKLFEKLLSERAPLNQTRCTKPAPLLCDAPFIDVVMRSCVLDPALAGELAKYLANPWLWQLKVCHRDRSAKIISQQ